MSEKKREEGSGWPREGPRDPGNMEWYEEKG